MYKVIIISVFLFLFSGNASASYYKVNVTRIAENLYRVENQYPSIYIVTNYCYVYGYDMDAIVDYSQFSLSNKIIFTNQNQTCPIRKIIR